MTHHTTTLVIAAGVALIGLFWPYFTLGVRLGFLVMASGMAFDSSTVGMVGLLLLLVAAVHGFVQARRRGRSDTPGGSA